MKKRLTTFTTIYNKPEDSNMKNFLGVDFGTTSLKACLFNEKGVRLATESIQYELITAGEFVEFPADKFFEVFKSVYDKISASFSIDALAIDTQGETLIVLDKDGNPLRNAIIWLDNRAEKQANEMQEKFGLKYVYERTGQAEIPAGYPLPKIKWLKENEPDLFEKADKFLLLEDYIIYRLTGKFYASRSLYSSSLAMNIKTGEYIPEFLEFAGIDESKLPTLVESGVVVGEYNGVKVVSSALDQISGIVGAGLTKEGIISETTGTALAVCSLTKEFPPYYDGLKVSVYYVKKGVYCLLMWAPTAGATMEWVKKTFCDGLDYGKINELAESVPAGCEGLICIPHLCGTVMPENNSKVKGVFYGMELKHTKGHFIRSVMESVAFTIKEFVEFMQVPTTEIRSMGGGANSKLWCEIKSSVTGMTVKTLKEKETACLGSAIFAGVGVGTFESINQASTVLVATEKEYSANDNYAEIFENYKNKSKELIKTF